MSLVKSSASKVERKDYSTKSAEQLWDISQLRAIETTEMGMNNTRPQPT
jgi:hypothetical protein